MPIQVGHAPPERYCEHGWPEEWDCPIEAGYHCTCDAPEGCLYYEHTDDCELVNPEPEP